MALDEPQDAEDEALALFHEISAEDPDRYDRATCDRTFKDALKSAEQFGPMTYATLISNGVPEPAVAAGVKLGRAPVVAARRLARAREMARKTERR